MKSKTSLPNFIIIGAPKAGTTTVYQYVAEHPQVAMGRRKEPCFFSFDENAPPPQDEASLRRYAGAIKKLSDYRDLFAEANGAEAIGEASANYLANEGAAARIHGLLPEARLIAILRNPADRAYSAYWMDVRKGHEKRPFLETIENWETREDPTSRYITEGFYHEQLARYREYFDARQMLVLLTEDLHRDPLATMQRVYRFLGVADDFAPDTTVVYNRGGIPKNAFVERLLAANWAKPLVPTPLVAPARKFVVGLRNINRKRPDTMSEAIRQHLGDIFYDDTCQLEIMLERDLSAWQPQQLRELPTTTNTL